MSDNENGIFDEDKEEENLEPLPYGERVRRQQVNAEKRKIPIKDLPKEMLEKILKTIEKGKKNIKVILGSATAIAVTIIVGSNNGIQQQREENCMVESFKKVSEEAEGGLKLRSTPDNTHGDDNVIATIGIGEVVLKYYGKPIDCYDEKNRNTTTFILGGIIDKYGDETMGYFATSERLDNSYIWEYTPTYLENADSAKTIEVVHVKDSNGEEVNLPQRFKIYPLGNERAAYIDEKKGDIVVIDITDDKWKWENQEKQAHKEQEEQASGENKATTSGRKTQTQTFRDWYYLGKVALTRTGNEQKNDLEKGER